MRTNVKVISRKVMKKPASITWQRVNKASDPKGIIIVLMLSSVCTVYMVKQLGIEVIWVRVGTTK